MCELLKSLPKMVKLAEGQFGAIYDVGNNRVMKVTKDKVDRNILELGSSSGIGPRIFGFEACPDGRTYYIQQKLVNPFNPEYASQLPELITHMIESGLLHNDLHTENMMADETGRLYLIDFDMAEMISKVGFSEGAFRNHSRYLDMNTEETIPIQFTEHQINRIRNIQENPVTKQAEINRKLEIQRIRDEARRQIEERQKEAIRRITGKGKKKYI
jgi:hypothetical protein